MKKFSNGSLNYNPYAEGTIKSRLYKAIKESLKSNQGEIVGMCEAVEELNSLFEEKNTEIQISILENIKNLNFEKEEFDAEPDDISTRINDMISKDEKTPNEENTEYELKESLSNDEVDYMLKKINS